MDQQIEIKKLRKGQRLERLELGTFVSLNSDRIMDHERLPAMYVGQSGSASIFLSQGESFSGSQNERRIWIFGGGTQISNRGLDVSYTLRGADYIDASRGTTFDRYQETAMGAAA